MILKNHEKVKRYSKLQNKNHKIINKKLSINYQDAFIIRTNKKLMCILNLFAKTNKTSST